MKKFFLYLDEDWHDDESDVMACLTDFLGFDSDIDEVSLIDNENEEARSISTDEDKDTFIFVFSDQDTKLYDFGFQLSGTAKGINLYLT